MGKKGDKMSASSIDSTEWILAQLSDIKDVTSKKMFGGHGLFQEQKMFGMVDSKGRCFLKAKDEISTFFNSQGSEKHSRMPYYSIPEEVLSDKAKLLEWVDLAITSSK